MLPPVTFRASGCITLTTDFGHKGPFVATMKGVIYTRFPTARIIDLTHETDVHFPAEAGFWLTHAYRYFPAGTVHVAVVDPGVGTQREIITVVYDGHAFVAPDNGLLGSLSERDGAVAYRLDLEKNSSLALATVSATFHGRDIFAPVGAALAKGDVTPTQLGPKTDDVIPSWIEEPTVAADKVTGKVVALDNFGNLITNIERRLVDQLGEAVVKAGAHTIALNRTYGDVTPGDYLALINSFDVLEVARAEGSAADGLGLSRGAPIVVTKK
ncbi:MAG TPA: hydroxide adenosyltransferase [Polyangiaceae bacterium]|nr:hydroxide adenosyltransferase [Polyangiaceae bacterium]